METKKTNQTEKELSPEEVAQREKLIGDYYDHQVIFLEKQKKYIALLTEIDELNYRRLRTQVAYEELTSGINGDTKPSDSKTSKPKTTK